MRGPARHLAQRQMGPTCQGPQVSQVNASWGSMRRTWETCSFLLGQITCLCEPLLVPLWDGDRKVTACVVNFEDNCILYKTRGNTF